MVEKEPIVVVDKTSTCIPGPVIINGQVVISSTELLKIREKSQTDAQKILDSVRLTVGDFIPIAAVVTGLLEFTWSHESD